MVDMKRLSRLQQQVAASRNLQLSPVDFVPGLLGRFISGELDASSLKSQWLTTTEYALRRFRKLPLDEVRNNQRIFGKEFALHDRLIDLIKAEQNDAELLQRIGLCMEEYLHDAQ